MDPFYFGAYWGSRRETALQCGERLAACIARLSEIDDALGSWFGRGASKAAAKTPVGSDAASLELLLAKGVNRLDVDGEVIEELGFGRPLEPRHAGRRPERDDGSASVVPGCLEQRRLRLSSTGS